MFKFNFIGVYFKVLFNGYYFNFKILNKVCKYKIIYL